MSKYKLDDLLDWGRVLSELKELRERGLLDEHQDGLGRIIRYKPNWQLRECALECARSVSLPNDELVVQACSVMCDEDSYPELRMRAAEAVADLFLKRAGNGGIVPSFEGVAIPERIRRLLAAPLNPLLARTLKKVLVKIDGDGP